MLKYSRWILTSLIFYALPLLMICYGLGTRFDRYEAGIHEKAYAYLDQVTLAIRKDERTEIHVAKLLTRVFDAACASPDPKRIFGLGLRNIKKRFPGILHCYVVDKNGKVVPELSEKNSPQRILQILFESVKPVLKGKDPDSRLFDKNWKLLKNFVGLDGHSDVIFSRHRDFSEVNSSQKNRWFYYSLDPNWGLFVHADHADDWENMAVKDQIWRFYRGGKHRETQVGVFSRSYALPAGNISRALDEFRRTSKNNNSIRGSLIWVTNLESTSLLWASIQATEFTDTLAARTVAALLITFIFAILAIFTWSIMLGIREFFFSIRWRLIILFIFASSLPLLVIFIAGWDYLHQKYETGIREASDNLERKLRTIDVRLPLMRKTMESYLNRRLDKLAFVSPEDRAKAIPKLTIIGKSLWCSDFMIYNKDGGIDWDIDSDENQKPKVSRGKKLMGDAIANVATTLNGEVQPKADFATNLVESFGNVQNPVGLFTKSLGKITEFNMANNFAWTYLKPLRSGDRVTHALMAHWRKMDLERSYITREVEKARSRGNRDFRLFGCNDNFTWKCPLKNPFEKPLKTLHQDVVIRQSTQSTKVYSGKKTFLITGIKPKEMSTSYLFGIMSDEKIRQNIFVLECRLAIFAAIVAIISIFLGVVLSQKLLHPIESLSLGVQAVQGKKWSHRVPKEENDELGELAEMFNGMIENLHEISVGRDVQNRLFPAEALTLGEYKVNGKSRPATQLGGDYLEYLAIGNRYLLVIMGDVTGHGVPAALVMAMSKALVLNAANAGADVVKIIDTLNLIIFQSMKKKLMMTAAVLWIDTETHQAMTFNCGHPFPFKLGLDGKIVMVEAAGSPLGARQKVAFKPNQFVLQPGERLFFYTDGLVESIEIDDGRAHFYHLMEFIEGRPPLPVELACDDILNNHFHTLTGLPQPDDFSIVIVERTRKVI